MAEERMLITGGQRLEGTVRVSGGKNTAVAIIPAAILSQTPCVIENLPNIEDVNVSVETLRYLGAKVDWDPKEGVMEVDSSTISRTDVPLELCSLATEGTQEGEGLGVGSVSSPFLSLQIRIISATTPS